MQARTLLNDVPMQQHSTLSFGLTAVLGLQLESRLLSLGDGNGMSSVCDGSSRCVEQRIPIYCIRHAGMERTRRYSRGAYTNVLSSREVQLSLSQHGYGIKSFAHSDTQKWLCW